VGNATLAIDPSITDMQVVTDMAVYAARRRATGSIPSAPMFVAIIGAEANEARAMLEPRPPVRSVDQ
jgi:hypothetical protein